MSDCVVLLLQGPVAVLTGHTAEVRDCVLEDEHLLPIVVFLIYLFVCVSVWLSFHSFVCSSVCLSICHFSPPPPLPKVSTVEWSIGRQEQLVLSASWDTSIRLVREERWVGGVRGGKEE